MSIWGDFAKGGIEGIATGIGGMAKDLRAAITGKSVLTNDDVVKLQTIVHEMELAALEADKAAIAGQIEVNKLEAQSSSFFRGGWRPAVGWVCVTGLFYEYIIRTIVPWLIDTLGYTVDKMPPLDTGTLLSLLFGLLGLGGLRTFEKVKGIK